MEVTARSDKLRYGVEIGGGNVDGGPSAETLTGPGPGAVFGSQLRGFKNDGVALTPIPSLGLDLYGIPHGLRVADWDVAY